MLDINKFIMLLKCLWIKRLIVGYSLWIFILKVINGEDFVNLLFDFGDVFIIECVIFKNNNFWKDVFKLMFYVIKFFDDNYIEENFLFMFIWYNSYIRVGMKILFIKSWYKKGVKVINDFLDDNGNFLLYVSF